MLSVAKVARGREGYYLATVASGREQAGAFIEPEGRWLGRAATSLGLAGAVDAPALRALLSGIDPATGEVLSAHHDRVRVAAYDCTYSTPKSVSLLHALGPEEVRRHVRDGHEEAAAAAFRYLERRGAHVRRALAPAEPRSTLPAGGMAAAAFLHRTSRAPDPHLHSHVLVANLAPGPDDRWSALDARGLFLELRTARDLYETQLRFELTSLLGVSWRELQGAWADLAGIDPEVRRAFSRRSAQIAAALEQTGRSSPRAARLAAMQTRPEKDLVTPYDELVAAWRERSYRLGVSDARLASVVGRSPTVLPSPADRWAEQALGQQGVASREGTCRRGDLVRSRCASLPSGAPVTEVERDVDALLMEGQIVPVPALGRDTGRRLQRVSGRTFPGGVAEPLYTTRAILGIHERLSRTVRENPGAVTLLAYRPGGRLDALDALDALGELAALHDATVTAVAPGRAVAASFESVTGIESTSVGLPAASASLVIVAEAHRLGPWELSPVVESSLAAGGRVVLFAPRIALEQQFLPAAILAPHLSPLTFDPESRDWRTRRAAGVGEHHRFGRREVVVVANGAAARVALLDAWREGVASGRRTRLVASDDAVVGALRDAVQRAGGLATDVVEARRLAGQQSGRPSGTGEVPVAVLGAFPTGIGDVQAAGCLQVAIVPAHESSAERVARAAEVARPRYLVSELGPVRSGPADRSAWRAGAAAIETFRRRWSIDDHERAFGDRSTLRHLTTGAVADLAETRLKVRAAVNAIDLATPARSGRAVEAQSRSSAPALER